MSKLSIYDCDVSPMLVIHTAPAGDSYFCEKCGNEFTETPHERHERRAPASLQELAAAVDAVEALIKSSEVKA